MVAFGLGVRQETDNIKGLTSAELLATRLVDGEREGNGRSCDILVVVVYV